eukprot:6901078-Alexandrium_andersonii.AAC.1
MGGRGPSSPNGPNGLLHGPESTEIRSPAFQRRAPEAASRGASNARICNTGGSELLQIPSRGEG